MILVGVDHEGEIGDVGAVAFKHVSPRIMNIRIRIEHFKALYSVKIHEEWYEYE